MKLKNIFTHIDFKYFIVIVMLLILILPLILSEKEPVHYLQKEMFTLPEDTPLPIYPKTEMPKPAKKIKNAYKPQEEESAAPVQVIQKIKENIKKENKKPAISRDFMFMDEEEETAPSYNDSAYYQNNGGYSDYSNNMTTTRNNANIIPANNGYYHQGKFYKEGTYPPNADKKTIDKVMNNYHNAAKTKEKNADIKGSRPQLNSFGNVSPSAKDLDKDKAYKPFPTNWGIMPNIAKPDALKDSVKTYKGGDLMAFNNRDNWPNGYLDNYNPYTLNMHDIYDSVANNAKNMSSNNYYNIERPTTESHSDSEGTSSASNSSVSNNNGGSYHSNYTQNSQTNVQPKQETASALTAEKHFKAGANSGLILAVGDEGFYNAGFSENYSLGVQHQIGCNATNFMFVNEEVDDYHIPEQMKAKNISLVIGQCHPSFDVAFKEVEGRVDKDKISEIQKVIQDITSKNEKRFLQMVSTDRTIYPLVQQLNADGAIVNSKGEPVTIKAIGPKEDEENLADALQDITATLITNEEDAQRLNKIISDFYQVSQLKPMNTMLAFPDENNTEHMFILNDPNNSYWLKNPDRITKYPQTTFTQNGVTYKGFTVDKKAVENILKEKRTNLIYVSGNNTHLILPNGSVVKDIKEGDYSISSLDPLDIEKNAQLLGAVTNLGYKDSRPPKVKNKK